MRAARAIRASAALLGSVVLAIAPAARAQSLRAGTAVLATAGDAERWGAQAEDLVFHGALRLADVEPDPEIPGRRQLRYDQLHAGVRVFGAQIVRHVDAEGRTVAVAGHLTEGLALDPRPILNEPQAARIAEGHVGPGSRAVPESELVVLPMDGGTRLAYMLWVRLDHQLRRVFVDADSGAIALSYDDLRTETAVGLGKGVWGDPKKLSVERTGSGYRARDGLRPPALATYDLRFNASAAVRLFETGRIDDAYLAQDADNDWTDGAVVDAHVYAGYTYDYLYKRLNRRGIDNRDLPVRSLVHIYPVEPGLANAFWDPYAAAMVYGDGNARYAAFSSGLDVVAHELTHGVTDHTWNGIYYGEPGALSEAFSDVIATSVEFFHQQTGVGRGKADYFLGEDVARTFDPARTAVRSMENPGMFCNPQTGCDPDSYAKLYRGREDNGGVHGNCGVANQAFYLLVEGGTNRSTGVRVGGLGASKRGSAERIFYRGFTSYLTPSATFADARGATVLAARDLFGPASAEAAETALAWEAVGVR
jgi:bacillolysin